MYGRSILNVCTLLINCQAVACNHVIILIALLIDALVTFSFQEPGLCHF